MAAVIHRTTLEYRPSANEPDYPEPTWKWRPDMTAVAGVDPRYWKAPADWDAPGAGPLAMDQAERDAKDAADAAALNAAGRATAVGTLDQGVPLGRLLKAFAGVLADELSLRPIVVGEVTQSWDPAAMANGTGLTSPGLAVAGAAFGDLVLVAAPYDLNGVVAAGYVSAADTVTVRLHNSTGANRNLAAGDWTVTVLRRVTRTLAQAKAAVVAKLESGEAD